MRTATHTAAGESGFSFPVALTCCTQDTVSASSTRLQTSALATPPSLVTLLCARLASHAVAFFKEAAALGDVYVSVGNDANVTALKQKPMFPEEERVYMVGSIRWVHKAFVAKGMGHDQGPDLDEVKPDIFFVNEDGHKESKAQQCAERGIEYMVAQRQPDAGLEARSSTSIKAHLT